MASQLPWTLKTRKSAVPQRAMERYPRGFLLTRKEPLETPQGWDHLRLGWWNLRISPSLGLIVASDGEHYVLLAGNPLDGTLKTEDIALNIANRSSRTERQDYVNQLAGSFVLIELDAHGSATLQTTGDGLRSVIYDKDGVGAASAEKLLVDALGVTGPTDFSRELLREERLPYPPGTRTGYATLRRLTANTSVEISQGAAKVRRIPTLVSSDISISEAADSLTARLSAQLEGYFADKEQVLIPITSGIDSRTTLSLLGPHLEKCKFFTYGARYSKHQEGVSQDVRTGIAIAKYIGVDHEVVEVSGDGTLPPEILALMRSNTSRDSAPRVVWALAQSFPDIKDHLLSFSYAVGKAPYLKRPRPELTPRKMAQMLSRDKKRVSKLAIKAFGEFDRQTKFSTAGGRIAPYDRFYWEHRLSVWGANVLAEYDFIHNASSLLSSREDILTMLVPSLEDRVGKRLQISMIEKNWPELLHFDVNGQPLG